LVGVTVLKDLKYEIVSRHSFDGGYVQEYVVPALSPMAAKLFACRSV
jgi:hypothetical protein